MKHRLAAALLLRAALSVTAFGKPPATDLYQAAAHRAFTGARSIWNKN